MQHFLYVCPQSLMEQQATAISFAKKREEKYPTWNIKRENVQYIFPKLNFVGEKEQQQTEQKI